MKNPIIDFEFRTLIPRPLLAHKPRPRRHDLQHRVLQILSLNINQMRDIVAICYSGVERKDRRKYQAAYAAVSRVLRRLHSQGVVSLGHEAETIHGISNYNDQPFWKYKSGGRWRQAKLNATHSEADLTSDKLNLSHRETDLTNAEGGAA
jgi:hypothetical protein